MVAIICVSSQSYEPVCNGSFIVAEEQRKTGPLNGLENSAFSSSAIIACVVV